MGIQQALVTVTGNLGAVPNPFTTSANVPACSFRMGVTPRFFDQSTGQWRDRGTSWVSVCAYRGLAKNILGSLEKGDPVIVVGTMRTERWQKDGVDRVTPVIDASAVGPDLSQGIARLNRIPRNQTGAGGAAAGAGGAGEPGASAAANAPESGTGAPGVGGQYGPPSNNPLNPAIPSNPIANAGGAPGVVIDTSGISDDTGGTVGNDDAATVSGEPAGSGAIVTGATGDDDASGAGDAGRVADSGAGDAAVDPATGEMREPDDFNSGTM
ncbi:single-stranded DNA-binding protein [Bifidobacterium aesculapii]|uniref:single-stranded DNA-binding protein n=1 Tax=Bifidobacterium aesculapii TaxID=1329411 RepID=UPI0006E3D0D6|nr:single-stranded DNA-binding protein [Bifidobacterium aesculapii]